MSGWLRSLLGVERGTVPEGAETRFEFARLPQGVLALLLTLGLLAAAAGILWVYRREGQASMRAKLSLAALRGLLVLVLALLLLEPVLAVDQVEEVEKSVVVLLDDSLSMTTKDRYTDPVARAALKNVYEVEPSELERSELLGTAMRKSRLLERLVRSNAVVFFAFSDTARPLGSVPRGAPAPEAPPASPSGNPRAGRGTNLGGAIRQAVEQAGSDRVAAVILLSDGRSTLGPPPEDVAFFLKNKDLRLHTVVVGESTPPRNLRAIALAGPDRIYKGDSVLFEGTVSSRGYLSATVLFERRAAGTEEWTKVGAESLSFPPEERPVSVRFSDRPAALGAVEYRISIPAEPDESTDRDNEKILATRVVEDRTKVLLVAGAPFHEYYAVKNTLLRDSTIALGCYLQSADPEFVQDGRGYALTSVPSDEKGLFEFDVVLLLDPNGKLLPAGFPALLAKFVGEHRGGLGFVAGPKYTLGLLRPGGPTAAIADLLPIVPDFARADRPDVGIGFGHLYDTESRMSPEAVAFTHPATRLTTDPLQAKALVWDQVPGFYWFFPAEKEKPGAVVLARHASETERAEAYGPRPIIAAHRYGGGQVLFFGIDETHRWRSTAERAFDRLWVQSVRFLMEGRLASARRRFRVDLDREFVDMGDAVPIRATAFTEQFKPWIADSARVIVAGPGGKEEEVLLLPVPGKEGLYAGSYAPPALGDYAIRAGEAEFRAKEGEDPRVAAFQVGLPDREMGDVRADRELLAELASRTRGTSPPLHELHRLGEEKLIPPASERVVTQGRPIPLWDNWLTISVVLLLLCAEWILRKRKKMV